MTLQSCYFATKGQIKPKSRLARHRFSQKMNERICFFCHDSPKILEILISSFKYFRTVKQKKKKNWFVWFLGESTACQSAYSFMWPLSMFGLIHFLFVSERFLIFLILAIMIYHYYLVLESCKSILMSFIYLPVWLDDI
jgi:hypothetical protein